MTAPCPLCEELISATEASSDPDELTEQEANFLGGLYIGLTKQVGSPERYCERHRNQVNILMLQLAELLGLQQAPDGTFKPAADVPTPPPAETEGLFADDALPRERRVSGVMPAVSLFAVEKLVDKK